MELDLDLKENKLISEIHKYIAPNLVGNFFIKKLTALQLFTNPMKGEQLHILLIGAPGTGKSDLLKDMSEISPEGQYLGFDSTKVGVRESLEDADGGILSADEVDKLKKNARSNFLEAMENGEITIKKHGDRNTYDARVNVLGAGNTKNFISDDIHILKQINFSRQLLNRFHIIMPFFPVDSDHYPEIAIKRKFKENDEERREKLKETVYNHLKNKKSVECSDKYRKELGNHFKKIKAFSPVSDYISPRQLIASITFSKASARMRGNDKVDRNDMNYVKKIMEEVYT